MTNQELYHELLLAMSHMLDKKLNPIEVRTRNMELLLENDVLPRLQNIESCYTATYRRYANSVEQLEAVQSDMDIVKKVVTEHSVKLQKIS